MWRLGTLRPGMRCLLVLLAVIGMGMTTSPASSAADGTSPTYSAIPISALPAPYANWNVTVTPLGDDPHVLSLTFDSPLLQRRITNTVYLPVGYTGSGAPTPVVYALHGTVAAPLDNCALNAVMGLDTVRMLGCGGGGVQDKLYDIPSQLGAMKFAVVSPDTSTTESICYTCMWVDGRDDLVPNVAPVTAKQLPADSFLHKELYPLVERLFNLRGDRAGRGVMGFSMGGWAAALQGMIHPDDYSYVGYISGAYDIKEPLAKTAFVDTLGYFRDQGYTTPLTDPVWWQQFNPRDIATNLKGANVTLLLTSGDGCVNLTDLLTSKYCAGKWSPVATPFGSFAEKVLDVSHKIAVRDLTQKGIPFTTVSTAGTHGANNADMFAQQVVPGANATFARGTVTPSEFAYRSAIPNFTIWGYDVHVRRAGDAFLQLSAAQADGRSFTVAGPGTATIATPPRFAPGSTHPVTIAHEGEMTEKTMTAGPEGSIVVTAESDSSPTTVTIS